MKKVKSFERKFKYILPNILKKIISDLLTNEKIGKYIKYKNPRKNLLGASYDFSLLTPKVAALLYFGIWESAETRFCLKYVLPEENIIELGGSIGAIMATLNTKMNFKNYIIVEANKQNFNILQKIRDSFFENKNISIIHKAISKPSISKVYFSNNSVESNHIVDKADIKKSLNCKIVPSTYLSKIYKTYIDGSKYTLITDIEGAEINIFFHDEISLKSCEKIICELEDTTNYTVDDQLKKLNQIGFEIVEQYNNVFVLFSKNITTKC